MNHHIFNWVLNSQLDFNSKFATLSSDTLVLDVLTSGGFVWFIYTVTRFDLSNESILKLRCNPPMNLWVFLRNYQYVAYPPDLIFIFHRIFCSYIYLLPGTKFHITQIDHILFGIICINSKFDLFLIFLIINENFKVIIWAFSDFCFYILFYILYNFIVTFSQCVTYFLSFFTLCFFLFDFFYCFGLIQYAISYLCCVV